jgi:hypothetical protein
MNHLRPIGAGVGILLAAALIVGCGGGSHGSGPLAGVGSTSGSTSGTVPVQSSQTAAVTVTVRIPPASQTAAARRNPAYVSPATSYITVSASPIEASGQGTCSGNTCTATIQAPISTTSMTVTLYSQGGNVLSMATQNVVIHESAVNNISFVFDGVASSFHVFSSLSQGVIGVNQTGTVTVVPYDAAGDEIMSPGNIIDSNGNVLVSADGTTQTITLSETGRDAAFLTLGALTWSAGTYQLGATETYNDGGAGSSGSIAISASSSASDVVTFIPYQLAVNPMSIQVIANPADGTPTLYQVLASPPANQTNTTVELPTVPTPPAMAPVPIYLTLVSNFNNTGDPLALTSDSCTNFTPSNNPGLGLNAAFPSPAPTMPSSLAYPFTLNISAPAPTGLNLSCSFTITDPVSNVSAQTTFGFDDTSLMISGKKRK